jgi:hypothetical protein
MSGNAVGTLADYKGIRYHFGRSFLGPDLHVIGFLHPAASSVAITCVIVGCKDGFHHGCFYLRSAKR